MLPWLKRLPLFVLSLILIVLAITYARQRLRRSLPRLKWLFLGVFLIYGWTTPGQYIWHGVGAPTDVGLSLGLEQLCRLIVVISSLQLILARVTKAEIYAAIYVLLTPLQYFNGAQSRFAVRFALTLEKAEELLESKLDFRSLMGVVLTPRWADESEVLIEVRHLNVMQQVLLIIQCMLMFWTIWMGMGGFWG